MIPHQLSAEQFDQLARGLGGPSAIETLREAQLSKRLLFLRLVIDRWPRPWEDRDAAIAVLDLTQRQSPASLHAVLAEPSTAGWLTRLVRELQGDEPPVAKNYRQLGAIAVAAAYRASVDADLTVSSQGGEIYLPTLGAFRLASPDSVAGRLRTAAGVIEAVAGGTAVLMPSDPDTTTPTWRPLRRLDATVDGREIVIQLDDLDPFRDLYHAPPVELLDLPSVRQWTELFQAAWPLLVGHVPERADELSAGLQAMVPLQTSTGVAKSGTARHVFGAFGVSLPESALDLAVTMVHEYQHSKLSAVLDLYPLVIPDQSRRYFAPWREDPRPIEGLLQGVYAFLAITDVYSAFMNVPSVESTAREEFAWNREQVRSGLATLVDSGGLTHHGERFAAGMQHSLDRLNAVAVPVDDVVAAQQRLAATRSAWEAYAGGR
jgi:HEXXH motif-containing protein